MADIRVHRYQVEAADHAEFVARRSALIAAMRAKHPGLVETRLIDIGDGAYIDTWRWQSAEEMQAAFTDLPNIPEAMAAMSLIHDNDPADGTIIDEQ